MAVLSTEFFGNSVQSYVLAIAVALLLFLLIDVPRRIVARRLEKLGAGTYVRWEQTLLILLRRTKLPFLYLLSIYVGSQILHLPPKLVLLIDKVAFVALLIQICIWGSSIIKGFVDHDAGEQSRIDGARAQSVRALGFAATLLLYVLVFLWALDGFGVNITTLIAGLGVGGIAVALALQNILGDLFASLTIVLDKPFVYGDLIIVGDQFKGRIENIGWKTTRVRSLSGEQLIFPNADLLQSRIRNFKQMDRRVTFLVSLHYETPVAELKAFPESIKRIIESQKSVRFDRAHLSAMTATSLDFEALYWVLDPDFSVFADIHQAIILKVLEYCESKGIQFAFPPGPVAAKPAPDNSPTPLKP